MLVRLFFLCLSFSVPCFAMEQACNLDQSIIETLGGDPEEITKQADVFIDAIGDELDRASGVINRVVDELVNSDANTCFRCRKPLEQKNSAILALGQLRMHLHKNCLYGLPLTAIDRAYHASLQLAHDFKQCINAKITEESEDFDREFENAFIAKQLFIKALLLEGILLGASAYCSYAAFSLEHLNGFRWWLIQAALLLTPDKFLQVSSNAVYNTLFRQGLVLGLAYSISRERNLAHLLLLDSFNTCLKPTITKAIPAISGASSYTAIREKLAKNYKQTTFIALGAVTGFCVLAPNINKLIAHCCNVATQKISQTLSL